MGVIVGKSNKPAEVIQDRLLVSSVSYNTDERQAQMSRAWILHSPARICNFGGPGPTNRSLIFWVKNNSSDTYILKNFNCSATKAVKTLGTALAKYEDEVYCVRQDIRVNLYYGIEPTFSASGSEDTTNLNLSNQSLPNGIDFRIPATPAIANYTLSGAIINCDTWYPDSRRLQFSDYIIVLGPGQTVGLTVNPPDANVFQNFATYCTLFVATPGVEV